jgi:hypothetical protein
VAFRRFMKLYSKQVRILDLPLGEEPIRAIDPLENEES